MSVLNENGNDALHSNFSDNDDTGAAWSENCRLASIRNEVARFLARQKKPPLTVTLFDDGTSVGKMCGQSLHIGESPVAYLGEYFKCVNPLKCGVAFTTEGIRYRLLKPGVFIPKFVKGTIKYSNIKTIGLSQDLDGDYELFINDKSAGSFITGFESGGLGGLMERVADEATCNLLSRIVDGLSPSPVGSLGLDNAAQELGELPKEFKVEDYLNGKSHKKTVPIVTFILVGICIVTFLCQFSKGSFDSDEDFLRIAGEMGAESAFGWLVCGFLHGGWIHILSNMASLLFLGMSAERLFGRTWFIVVYFVSLIGGAIGADMVDPEILSVGASGGILGLAGALSVYGGLRFGQISAGGDTPRAISKAISKWIGENCVFLLQNLWVTVKYHKIFSISVGGHIGGLIAGVICGIVLYFSCGQKSRQKDLA